MTKAYDYCEPDLAQKIPGVNREDDVLKYSHTSRFCTKIGEITADNNISLRAAVNKDHAPNIGHWCDSGKNLGEELVRQSFASRNQQIHHWQRNLKQEIDNLIHQDQAGANSVRLLLKTVQHLNRVKLISAHSLEQRVQIAENAGPNDVVNKSIEEEITICASSLDEIQMLIEKLQEIMRQMELSRKGLLSDTEAKTMNLIVSKSCQHNDILLSFPYFPQDKPSDQPIQQDDAHKWECDVNQKIQTSISLREACTDICRNAENSVASSLSLLAAAWLKSNNLLNEDIQKDEYQVFKIKQILNTTVKDITATKQYIASLYSNRDVQQCDQELTAWRMQRLTYRPGFEHIMDPPVENLKIEMQNIDSRLKLLEKDIKDMEQLFNNLVEMKSKQLQELAAMSKKLFIDRVSCVGLRNTIKIDGTDGKNI